jgi:hypothetical protein
VKLLVVATTLSLIITLLWLHREDGIRMYEHVVNSSHIVPCMKRKGIHWNQSGHVTDLEGYDRSASPDNRPTLVQIRRDPVLGGSIRVLELPNHTGDVTGSGIVSYFNKSELTAREDNRLATNVRKNTNLESNVAEGKSPVTGAADTIAEPSVPGVTTGLRSLSNVSPLGAPYLHSNSATSLQKSIRNLITDKRDDGGLRLVKLVSLSFSNPNPVRVNPCLCVIHTGGLGNRMFKYASAYGIAAATNTTMILPRDSELRRLFNISAPAATPDHDPFPGQRAPAPVQHLGSSTHAGPGLHEA